MRSVWRLLAGLFLVSALGGCVSNYEPSAAVQSHLKAAGFLPYAGKGYYCPKATCGDELLAVYFRGEVKNFDASEYSTQVEIASGRLNRAELERRISKNSDLNRLLKSISIKSIDRNSSVVIFHALMPVQGVDYKYVIRARVVENELYMSGIAGVNQRMVSRYFTPQMLD